MNKANFKNRLNLRLSENVIDALRNVAVIVLPLLLAYRHTPELATGIAAGVLIVSLTDMPGNMRQKIQTAWQSVLVTAVVAVGFNLSLAHPLATGFVLCIFSFVLALSNGFGPAAGAVGMSGIVLMIFMLGLRPTHPLQFSAYMVVGALLFHGVVLLQTYIQPFRSLRQDLEGLLKLTSDFLLARADCYDPAVPLEVAYQKTLRLHLLITSKQDSVRQLLLTDSVAMRQQDRNVQQLLSTAIMTMQLYEHFIATPLDHGHLREALNESGALKQITALLKQQAGTLNAMANRLPYGMPVNNYSESETVERNLKKIAAQCGLKEATQIEAVLQNAAAVKLLLTSMAMQYTTAINPPSHQLQRFLPNNRTVRSTLALQLNWHSPFLRFALRLTFMLCVAYCAVFAFTTDIYNYWFLLTILVVSRPRVALTWQRNLERISGTVAGLVIAYVLLALTTAPAILLSIAAICLTAFYALNRAYYAHSVFAITICAVLFAGVYSGGSANILYARLIYTLAGCALAMAGIFVFPVWIKAQLDALAKAAVTGNAKLLRAVSDGEHEIVIRLARKEAHQHIALLFEGLQHAQYEPGVQNVAKFKHILLLNYRINSAILALFLFDGAHPDKKSIQNALLILENAGQIISQPRSLTRCSEISADSTLLEALATDLCESITMI